MASAMQPITYFNGVPNKKNENSLLKYVSLRQIVSWNPQKLVPKHV